MRIEEINECSNGNCSIAINCNRCEDANTKSDFKGTEYQAGYKQAYSECIQYIVNQGTIEHQSNTTVYFITDEDIYHLKTKA